MKEILSKSGLTLMTVLFLMGCSQDLPFEYRYLSRDVVQIQYQGNIYQLNRLGRKVPAPFDYQFESDGDIDITVDGKTYDIDSPFDIDKPKVKKKTTKKRRSSSRSKKR